MVRQLLKLSLLNNLLNICIMTIYKMFLLKTNERIRKDSGEEIFLRHDGLGDQLGYVT